MTLTVALDSWASCMTPPSAGCNSSACWALIIQWGPTSLGGQGSVSGASVEQTNSWTSMNSCFAASVEKVNSPILSTSPHFTSPQNPPFSFPEFSAFNHSEHSSSPAAIAAPVALQQSRMSHLGLANQRFPRMNMHLEPKAECRPAPLDTVC